MQDPEPRASLVTVTTCKTLADADLVVSQLQAAGLDAFLPDEALMENVAWNLNTYGYVRVQVRLADLEAAKAALAGAEHAEIPHEQQQEPEREQGRADLPLPWLTRVVALLLPGVCLIGLIIFGMMRTNYANRGYKRRVSELTACFLLGVIVWFVLLTALISRAGH